MKWILPLPLHRSASSWKQLKTKYFLSSLGRTTNKAGLPCLFWCIKPDPQNWPQQQTYANPRSGASRLWFISYFHLIGGCFGVIRFWQWALCCGWAVYIALLETCWHWGGLRQRAEPLSRSGQYLDLSWAVVGKDRSIRAKGGKTGWTKGQEEKEN